MIDPRTGYDVTPSSIKAVIVRRSQVLLCLNDRDEWELPGGWPAREDVSLETTLRREVLEETALDVEIDGLLTAELLRTPNDGAVALVIYRASALNDDPPIPSSEHREVRFFGFDEVPRSTPEPYLRAIDQARRT